MPPNQIPIGLALKKPCGNCPFLRRGAIDLAPGRLDGIIADLVTHDDKNFQCHKTLSNKRGASNCVGSTVYALKIGRPSVSMRFAMAMGLVDRNNYERWNDLIINPPGIT